jgi:hypothetical protein
MMDAKQYDRPASVRAQLEHVVEVSILKDHFEHKRINYFPAVCACAIPPLPRLSDPGKNIIFRFYLEDWDNVVGTLLENHMIPHESFRILTRENQRPKLILVDKVYK